MAAGVLSAATPAIVLFITPGSLIPVIKRNSPITSDIVTGLTNTFLYLSYPCGGLLSQYRMSTATD